jgi:hypothetical protein
LVAASAGVVWAAVSPHAQANSFTQISFKMPNNKIDLIVKILLDEEGNLSDGYGYYGGTDESPGEDVETKLRRIANSILLAIEQQEK